LLSYLNTLKPYKIDLNSYSFLIVSPFLHTFPFEYMKFSNLNSFIGHFIRIPHIDYLNDLKEDNISTVQRKLENWFAIINPGDDLLST